MINTLFNNKKKPWWKHIRSYYWRNIPHNWRPGHIWYCLKCFLWHRYTTYKPRTLGHTWCDRSELIPHMIFEILSQFIDKECDPGPIDWYGEHGHKIIPGVNYDCYDKDRNHPDCVYALDYMKELRNWFYDIYLKEIDDTCTEWYEFHKEHCVLRSERSTKHTSKSIFDYDSPENKKRDRELMDEAQAKENRLNQKLEDKMIEIIKIRGFMWT